MRLLLDTHSALWMFAGSPSISVALQHDLTDPAHELFFSDASAWEIVIKHSLGKLPLPEPPSTFVPSMLVQHGIARLPITLEAIFDWGRLPAIHRDPFDRMLIAQAVRHGCALVTCDPEIQKYSVTVHWR
ncbi:MAG: type II toxin-antitoxin system VapC family toxin [Verrucomicrobiales bacterium]|nr:type II toxin-antitoxin system VapC family toxin [Verrucomicrobiales bacterium]